MNAMEMLRLECVRLADGDVIKARQIADFVTGASDLAKYVESAGYEKDNGIAIAKGACDSHYNFA